MYLNCKTFFSFRYGTYSTAELVEAGVNAGAAALALTNINCTADTWDFVRLCQARGIKPVCGAEIRNGDKLLYILLAANNRGFSWINAFISTHLQTNTAFPQQSTEEPFFADTWDGYVIYPWSTKPLQQLHINEFIGILPSEVTKLYSLTGYLRDKIILRQPVTVQDKTYHNVHKLLRAIDHNVVYTKMPHGSICSPDEMFLPMAQLMEKFQQYPYVLSNTFRLIDTCEIKFDEKTSKNKQVISDGYQDDVEFLTKLAYEGLAMRYGNNAVARQRLEKELKIIADLGFTAYFLIAWDIIRYAQGRRFFHVGRGSGANSIVAYCLKITDVDPIELNLFFERFLNPERTSPPDFDIDFSHTDRDEIFDYIFKRYGRRYVALMGNYSTFQYNAVVHELSKVFGLPAEEAERLKATGHYYKESREKHFLVQSKLDQYQEWILRYGLLINNFPNYPSVHACGIVITQAPIHDYCVTWLPPKGFPTMLMDMYLAESIGIDKLDILSQRGLSHMKSTIELVRENLNETIHIEQVEKFKKDEGVKKSLREVNTIGCFYIESPAMRQLLGKLKCDLYETLVVASSIIRPGVASSGMMREYITRYHNREAVSYLHPKMEALLGETFGVMVFQEDVMRVGHEIGQLTMGEADTLRRAMSGKYKGNNRFELMKERFFANCKTSGIADEVAAEIWRQMESFAGYSFCKAHSASYAVMSFQDLYLKTYYPAEFMVGVINNFGGFYSTELYFIELRKTGVTLHLPCINDSEYYTLIKDRDVYTGLVHLKGLEEKVALTILAERRANGPYLHVQDFIERTGITPEQLNILISVGALRFTGKTKKRLLWEANFLQRNIAHHDASHTLFKEEPLNIVLPELTDDPIDDCYDEMEILGFPFRNPFELCDEDPGQYLCAGDLKSHLGKSIKLLLYFIDYKAVTTKHLANMSFGTFLDVHMDWVDTVHFPQSLERYPLRGRGFYHVHGKVVEDFGVYSVEVHYQEKIGYKQRKYANL